MLASKLLTAAVGGSVGGFSQSSHPHVVLSSDLNCPSDAFVEPFSVTTNFLNQRRSKYRLRKNPDEDRQTVTKS